MQAAQERAERERLAQQQRQAEQDRQRQAQQQQQRQAQQQQQQQQAEQQRQEEQRQQAEAARRIAGEWVNSEGMYRFDANGQFTLFNFDGTLTTRGTFTGTGSSFTINFPEINMRGTVTIESGNTIRISTGGLITSVYTRHEPGTETPHQRLSRMFNQAGNNTGGLANTIWLGELFGAGHLAGGGIARIDFGNGTYNASFPGWDFGGLLGSGTFRVNGDTVIFRRADSGRFFSGTRTGNSMRVTVVRTDIGTETVTFFRN
jgi:hypothetical protein